MSKRLQEPKVFGLSQIQQEFDSYQNQAFPPRQPEFFALELCGEAGELANLVKKQWRDPSKEVDFDHLSDEAADVFIALMNFVNSKGISLEESVAKKLRRIEDKRLAGQMGKTAKSH